MPQGKGTYGSKMGRPPKKRSMEVVRMPAGKSQTDFDLKGRQKMAGPKPTPKPKTSVASERMQTLPYGGGKPKAKKLPGSSKAPKVRKLGR